jgi:hypothetical protein
MTVAVVLGLGIAFYLTPKPCSKPVTFSLGAIDPKFNIARSTLLTNLDEVTSLWNAAHPNILKRVDSGGDVVISFVYDERQRTTIRNERLKRAIDQQKSELNALKGAIEITQSTYDAKSANIQSKTTAYLARLKAYQANVDSWNERGGAPKEIYDGLKQEQLLLEVERLNLNNAIADLNALGQQIKNTSGKHNAVVADVNAKVETINKSTNREFEEGVYDPNTQTITIYEFESPLSLKRVLAHELGHAIGIDHVGGKDSIMYAYNDSPVFKLSEEDTQALAEICTQK